MMFLLRMLTRARNRAMDPLQVSMTGVRMGERFVQIGCHDRALLSGLAAKVGLSGTAAVAAFDDAEARRAGGVVVKTIATRRRPSCAWMRSGAASTAPAAISSRLRPSSIIVPPPGRFLDVDYRPEGRGR